MKVWLDDQRSAPPGWLWLRKVDEVIKTLENHPVEDLSLDYDLDFSDPGRYGVEVLAWIHQRGPDAPRPAIHIHSANPFGAAWMALWINALEGGPEPTPALLREALLGG